MVRQNQVYQMSSSSKGDISEFFDISRSDFDLQSICSPAISVTKKIKKKKKGKKENNFTEKDVIQVEIDPNLFFKKQNEKFKTTNRYEINSQIGQGGQNESIDFPVSKKLVSAQILKISKCSNRYYLHFSGFDKRNACWLSQAELLAIMPQNAESQSHGSAPLQLKPIIFESSFQSESPKSSFSICTRQQSKEDLPQLFKNYKYNRGQDFKNTQTAHNFEQQIFQKYHEEQSQVKNVDYIHLGPYDLKAWYWSPYPLESEETSCEETPSLYICEMCLKYGRNSRHRCQKKQPPGKMVYQKGDIQVYQVEGKNQKLYCQNLCLLGKLFLDNKTLFFDVETFQFFVITEGGFIVGYFSREMNMSEDHNLACIMVLPPFQRRGFGKFLISLSYYLSGKIEDKVCTPERPLSKMGALSYQSYWKDAIFKALSSHQPFLKSDFDVSVRELSEHTNIQIEDIIMTLQSMDMLKYWKGQYIIKNISQKRIKDHLGRTKNQKGVQFDEQCMIL